MIEDRVLGAHQDQLLVGAKSVQNVDDLYFETLRGGPPEDGQPVAPHPALDFIDRDGSRYGPGGGQGCGK